MHIRHEQDQALIERLRCPRCGGSLAAPASDSATPEAVCRACGARYPRIDGIWRLLTGADMQRYGSFLERYRALRQREGWERAEIAYYLGLPQVPATDPAAAIWRIRRRSFRRVQATASPGAGGWALDLGAGHGWLARYLAQWGYRPVALDLNAAGPDSLAGAAVYLEHGGVWFDRVQASMDRLPLAEGAFALCTISGALHYADLPATLREIARVLAPGGLLIITDSPVYATDAAGRAMVRERAAQARARFGAAPDWPGGAGYLVEPDLRAALRQAGFAARFLTIERPLGRLKRLFLRRLRPARREEARFPVVVARKPG
jgi:SAM-dependent methyltransferase/uncharacterized protein YbaR (Trm112 family)